MFDKIKALKTIPMVYQHRIIAFIDIIGFTQNVRLSDSDENKVKLLYDSLHHINQLFLQDVVYNQLFDTQVVQFSDSLIISIKENQPGGLKYLISDCSLAIHSLFTSGLLCRGYILKGKLIHTSEILFGPAYLDILYKEAETNYPLIRVPKSLLNIAALHNDEINTPDDEVGFVMEHLKEYDEEHFIINTFYDYDALVGAGNESTKKHYENLGKYINIGLKSSTKLSHYYKYDSIRKLFNESPIVKGHKIELISYKFTIFKIIWKYPQYLYYRFVHKLKLWYLKS